MVAGVGAGAGGVAFSWLRRWWARKRWWASKAALWASKATLWASCSSWSTMLSSSSNSLCGSRVASRWAEESIEFEFEFIVPQTAMYITEIDPRRGGELLITRETPQVITGGKFFLLSFLLRFYSKAGYLGLKVVKN